MRTWYLNSNGEMIEISTFNKIYFSSHESAHRNDSHIIQPKTYITGEIFDGPVNRQVVFEILPRDFYFTPEQFIRWIFEESQFRRKLRWEQFVMAMEVDSKLKETGIKFKELTNKLRIKFLKIFLKPGAFKDGE